MDLRDIKARDHSGVGSIFGIDDLLIMGGLSLAGSVIGGSSSKNAAKTAANAQADATAQNNALARELYGKNEGNLQPYIQQGYGANPLIAGALGYGEQNATGNAFAKFAQASGFDSDLENGSNAITQNAAVNGMLRSGSTLKGLQKFGTQLRSNYFGDYLNRLGAQQGVGLNAANGLAGVSSNYGGQVAANNNAMADATGNAALVGANATNNLIGSGLNAFGQYAGLSSYGKKAA